MTRVRFELEGFEVDVEPGTELIDVTDEHPDTGVPFSCRSASCGTCRVKVLAGEEALSPMEEDEKDVLEIFGDGPGVRLCCQIKLVKDVEKLVLEVCDP